MIVKIKLKDKTDVVVYNVFSIEETTFDIRLKQLKQNYVYELNKYHKSNILDIKIELSRTF